MLENLTKKQIIFMIVIIIYYIYSTLSNIEYTTEDTINNTLYTDTLSDTDNLSTSQDITKVEEILVHISGCVKENKVVSLPVGSRINDAIEAAGGLTDEADLTNINLAYILEDGEKIYVPKKGENNIDNNTLEQTRTTSSTNTSLNKNLKININKASQSELETLPGIGASIALKIINYRNEHGNFSSIEDIKKISGIGNSKFEEIKNYIIIK